MGTKILVYDNQQAYFELLKTTFLEDYQFILSGKNMLESIENKVDMIVFFVYDELELMDFVKLYSEDIPVVLGISAPNETDSLTTKGNIHYLNVNKLKNQIIDDISALIDMLFEKV